MCRCLSFLACICICVFAQTCESKKAEPSCTKEGDADDEKEEHSVLLQNRHVGAVTNGTVAMASKLMGENDGVLGGTTNSSAEKVVFLMRTGGQHSADRIKAVQETWGKHLSWGPNGRIVPLHADQDCKQKYGDNHGFGLTCLESHTEVELLSRRDFEFVFILDDDVYVNVNNLEHAIVKLQLESPTVWGTPGCGKCESGQRTGFCGGGGYLISRHNLALVASNKSLFLEEFNRGPDQEWCDVRFACVAQLHNFNLTSMYGLYPWAFKNTTEEDRAMLSQHVPPLTFHYATPQRMRELHIKFQQFRLIQLGAAVDNGLTMKEYNEQMHEYIRSEQKQRANM